ncbi:MAG: hypothetical protein RSD32_04120, partial [Oscillospiraceae bacterium]
ASKARRQVKVKGTGACAYKARSFRARACAYKARSFRAGACAAEARVYYNHFLRGSIIYGKEEAAGE